MNRPENRTTRDQSQFLNELIERKTFSWTHVLEDLEKVMPARVHLVSIHPELDEDNQLTLKMMVAGDSRDKGWNWPSAWKIRDRFTQTLMWSGKLAVTDDGEQGYVQFDIVGIYVPETDARAETRENRR